MVAKPKIDEIERSPENKCRLKNAFLIIIRQGVDTPISQRKLP